MLSYYDLLGVKPEASAAEIKARYRELARTLHPDLQESDPLNEIGDSKGLMPELNEAYRVLSDPEERIAYDSKLNAVSSHVTPHPSDNAEVNRVDEELFSASLQVTPPRPWIMRGLMFGLLISLIALLVINFKRPNQRDFNQEFGSAKTLFKPQVDRALRGDMPSLSEGLASPQGLLLRQMAHDPLSVEACLETFPHQLTRVSAGEVRMWCGEP